MEPEGSHLFFCCFSVLMTYMRHSGGLSSCLVPAKSVISVCLAPTISATLASTIAKYSDASSFMSSRYISRNSTLPRGRLNLCRALNSFSCRPISRRIPSRLKRRPCSLKESLKNALNTSACLSELFITAISYSTWNQTKLSHFCNLTHLIQE